MVINDRANITAAAIPATANPQAVRSGMVRSALASSAAGADFRRCNRQFMHRTTQVGSVHAGWRFNVSSTPLGATQKRSAPVTLFAATLGALPL